MSFANNSKDSSHLEYVKDKGSAFQMWTSLCDTFERKSVANQLLLRKKLLLMRFNSGKDSLANHFLIFDKLIRDLKATGVMMEETNIVYHLLFTMPQEYDSIVTVIGTLLTHDLKINFVKNRLLDQESRRVEVYKRNQFDSEKCNAFHVQSNKNGSGKFENKGKSVSGGEKKFPFNCHFCGEQGHKRADCKKRHAPNSKSNSENSANSATCATKVETLIVPRIVFRHLIM